jgi:hypothetical protein
VRGAHPQRMVYGTSTYMYQTCSSHSPYHVMLRRDMEICCSHREITYTHSVPGSSQQGSLPSTKTLHLPTPPSINPTIHPPTYLSNYPSVYLSTQSIHSSIHPSICLPIHLPFHLFIHPPIYLSIYPPFTYLSITYSPTHLSFNSFIYPSSLNPPMHPPILPSFNLPFIYPATYSFIHPLIHHQFIHQHIHPSITELFIFAGQALPAKCIHHLPSLTH